MNLYVYRISESEYGAGLGKEECMRLGTIVETWPLNTEAEAKFLASHGSNFYGVSDKVSKLADLVHDLLALDPTIKRIEYQIRIVEQPTLWQRLKQWFFVR